MKNWFKKVAACAMALTLSLAVMPAKTYAANGVGWVYFLKYGGNSSEIWRVKSDGSTASPEKVSANFDTSKDYDDYIKRGGDYFYYLKDSKTMFRIPAQMPEKGQSSRIIVDNDNQVLNFRIVDDFVYYLNDKNRILRFGVNAVNTAEIKSTSQEVVNMVLSDFPAFFIESGRIYFNVLKDGRTLWLASKAADGSGEISYISPGVLDHHSLAKRIDDTLYFLINTNPEEQQYSTDCIALVKAPVAGGEGTVLTTAPIDINAAYSGKWTDSYYMFNAEVDTDEYDFPIGKGKLLSLDGNITDLHDQYVFEIVHTEGDKHVFVDGYKTYSADIQGGVVSNKTDLGVNDTYYVRNLKVNNEIRTTALFGENGTYILNKNMEATQLVGVEWDMCLYANDVSGIFYINAGDEGKLYKVSEDGQEKIKLTDDKILQILTIEVAE